MTAEHIVKLLTARGWWQGWCTTCGWTGRRFSERAPASAEAALHADRVARGETA